MSFGRIKNKYILLVPIFLIGVFFVLSPALAQVSVDGNLGGTFGLTTRTLYSMVISFVNALLGFLGVIAVSVIIYGGYIWMTSGGVPEKVNKAKKILINAVIGLGIIMLSFAIVQFISKNVAHGPGGPVGPGGGGGGGGALGGGIIESVYPAPGARNVARNTSMVVTFKEAMDPATVIDDTNGSTILGDWVDDGDGILEPGEYDTIAGGAIPNVKIALQGNTITGPWITEVFASKTADDMTFVFKPVNPLGNSSTNTWYATYLTSAIQKTDGTSALGVAGYTWSFQIGTFLDVTPPRVVSARPIDGGTYDRNIVIQIVFSEAISPLSIKDSTIVVDGSVTSPISGTLYVANQYRTVEFLGSPCGVNSCNETIYCLPELETITTTILAADCGTTCPETLVMPFDGVVDMANNSLDGDADGIATGPVGPPADNYSWFFSTTDNINLTPPTILSVLPVTGDLGVTLSDPVEILFSDVMMHSTLTTSNVKIINPIIGYWVGAENVGGIPATQTRADIFHHKFSTATQHTSEVTSAVKNEYQNCFYPSSNTGTGCTGAPYCCEDLPSTCACDNALAPCP
jgi:hypothetical protein